MKKISDVHKAMGGMPFLASDRKYYKLNPIEIFLIMIVWHGVGIWGLAILRLAIVIKIKN